MMNFTKNIRGIIRDFDSLERLDIQKPQVGIVGEILVKFSPTANNHIVELLESEGAEAVMPDLMDFLLYCFYNSNFKAEHLGGEALHRPALQYGESPYWSTSARLREKPWKPASTSRRPPRSEIPGRPWQSGYRIPGQPDR